MLSDLKLGDRGVDIANQFHYLFWFGDLNYRVDIEFEKTLQLIQVSNRCSPCGGVSCWSHEAVAVLVLSPG